MGRKKKETEEKKVNVGITINPDLLYLIEQYSNKQDISKSQLIDNIMREHFTKKEKEK